MGVWHHKEGTGAWTILDLPGAAGGMGALAFLLLVAQASDVAQYVFGKRFGRTRLAPSVSPSKTREQVQQEYLTMSAAEKQRVTELYGVGN